MSSIPKKLKQSNWGEELGIWRIGFLKISQTIINDWINNWVGLERNAVKFKKTWSKNVKRLSRKSYALDIQCNWQCN